MKTSGFSVILLCCVLKVYGQVAMLDKAHDLILKKDFAKAQAAIQLAEKNAATASDARTYYLKAFIEKELYVQATDNEKHSLRNVSWKSIVKSQSLDHDNIYQKPLKQLKDFLLASLYNEGVEAFNNENFIEANKLFKDYLSKSDSQDTYWLDANYYIGNAYNALEQKDSAMYHLQLVKKKSYDQPLLYLDLSYLFLADKNETDATNTIDEGLKLYPDNYDLQIARLNVLSGFKRDSLLQIHAEAFVKIHPDDIGVLLMLASTYERDKNEERHFKNFSRAEALYKHIIELEPENYNGNYNLGVLYYNEAVDLVNKTELDTDVELLTKILEKSTALFEKALPLLLKIRSVHGDNLRLLQALQAIYYNLNMKQELRTVTDQIKEFSAH